MTDLIAIMSKLVDSQGKILIPGVDEMVHAADEEEKYVLLFHLNVSRTLTMDMPTGRYMRLWITASKISRRQRVVRLR